VILTIVVHQPQHHEQNLSYYSKLFSFVYLASLATHFQH